MGAGADEHAIGRRKRGDQVDGAAHLDGPREGMVCGVRAEGAEEPPIQQQRVTRLECHVDGPKAADSGARPVG